MSIWFSKEVDNFQHIGKDSFRFRFLPHIFVTLSILLVLSLVLSFGFSWVKHPEFIPFLLLLLGGVFLLVCLVTYIAATVAYSNLTYLIEENSLFLKEGVFTVDTETIPFQKIRNASFTQKFLQRIYHVGDIIIDQDPEQYVWKSIDEKTARLILDAVAAKSNIQPIVVSGTQQIPGIPTQQSNQ